MFSLNVIGKIHLVHLESNFVCFLDVGSLETCSFLPDFSAVCSQIYGNVKGPMTLNDGHTCYSSNVESCSLWFSAMEDKLFYNVWIQCAIFLLLGIFPTV